MTSILAECLLFDSTRRLPARRLAVYTLIVAASAMVVERGLLTRHHPFTKDGHAIMSLEMALNATVCGKPSAYAVQFHPGVFISLNEWASYVPARQVVASVAGSVDAYCADLTVPYVNEDNSLGLLEESFLDARPGASADQVGRFLLLVRIGLIVAVCALVLSLGASVVFCSGMAIGALVISHKLLDNNFGFSIYPFFFVLVLVNAAVVYGALRLTSTGRVPMAVAGGLVSGFVAAASVNMRASYLPVYIAFQLCCWWAVWRTGRRDRAAAVMISSVALAFAAGYFLFQYPFITRRVPAGATGLHTHHPISHPLVLSLAMPPNDLATREGIAWSDHVGTTLALRVDPKATYLGPGYERALFTYYRSLWRQHPREMARIYVTKFRLAGAQMLQQGTLDPAMRKALWLLTWIRTGPWLAGVYVLSALAAFAIHRRRGSGLAFYIGLLFVAGFLLYVESAIIMPYYYVMYHNYLLFLSLFWCLLVYQAGLNGAAYAIRMVTARRVPEARDTGNP